MDGADGAEKLIYYLWSIIITAITFSHEEIKPFKRNLIRFTYGNFYGRKL